MISILPTEGREGREVVGEEETKVQVQVHL
jgi:hypothetical protein